MNDLRFNKIAGAILATGLLFIGVMKIGDFVYSTDTGGDVAYGKDILESYYAEQAKGSEPEVILPFPQADWVAAMDETRGAVVFKKCQSCHSDDKGGATKTGPNLWNIVGTAAGQKDFAYSSAMKESGKTWNYESLDDYLEKPSRYIKGTAMSFAGLKKPADRAAVIEYLRVRADSPLDRPDAVAAPVVEEAVPTESETAEGTPMEETPTETPAETPTE